MQKKPLLCLDNIQKSYDSYQQKTHILKGISLEIQQGEFVAIMGHSGSGKSTLMNILGCLDAHYTGSYILDNKPIHKMSNLQLANIRNKIIGFVFQGFNLLKRMNIIDNIALPLLYSGTSRIEARKLAMQQLERLNLQQLAFRLPNQLSGGQQQRIAIARALVNNPLLLLADEPTGNLDSTSSELVMSWFKELHEQHNITIILVTHEADIAMNAQRLIKVKDGQISFNGNVEQGLNS